jgi:hypothetical protein
MAANVPIGRFTTALQKVVKSRGVEVKRIRQKGILFQVPSQSTSANSSRRGGDWNIQNRSVPYNPHGFRQNDVSCCDLRKSKGFGFGNMYARVAKIGGQLEIRTAVGRGTNLLVAVPIL